jgi:hypothetical protein
MNQNQLDRFYLIYVLLVTILILGFSWIIFESQYIYGQKNAFAAKNQEDLLKPSDSLSETAKDLIDISKKKIYYYKAYQNSTKLIEQI